MDGQCWYWDSQEKVPWASAQDICQADSGFGNLLSIHNDRDNAYAADFAYSGDMWIGLQIKAENDYEWVDGSTLDFQSWKENGK